MQEFKVGDRVCEAGTDNTGIIDCFSDLFAWVQIDNHLLPVTCTLARLRKVTHI